MASDAPDPQVVIYSPMPLASGKGNAVSALRIAGLLCEAGIHATATDRPATDGAAVLVVLNAWRSAAVALEWKRRNPARPLVAVLTGTDIFPDFPSHPEVERVLAAADAIVAWHGESVAQLPERFRAKARIIFKSAPDIPADMPRRRATPDPPARIEVLIIGHLREVKDPFRAAEAARMLPGESRLHFLHAGEALSPDMAARAAAEMAENPRYTWLGGITRQVIWQGLRTASLTVNSSLAEGGANAVVESLRCGVPVLASRIPGNTGLLGRDWPGFFDTGDSAALAALLQRCEHEPEFYGELISRTARRGSLFIPETEKHGWNALIQELRS